MPRDDGIFSRPLNQNVVLDAGGRSYQLLLRYSERVWRQLLCEQT